MHLKYPHANRGNVAIIVWNTIEAPYVWDVIGTEFTDSSINLSNSERSLLSIYFRDFATKKGELKEIAEVEIAEEDIKDRQLVLDVADVEFANEFDKEPNRNKDEKSYKVYDANGDLSAVRIYVPEEVMEDLDEVEDKTVTLILGEDNVAVAVIITDDTAKTDFLTAYDAEKEKITVGGTKYELAEDVITADKGTTPDAYGYTVELNGATVSGDYSKKVTPIAAALKLIKAVTNEEDIEKKIQAEITLNEDDEVEAIELFVSAELDNTTEVIVTKIRETSKRYEIQTTAGDIEWELEDEEDLEFPKVYTNGARSDIKDIEVGNVLTVITGKADASDIKYEGNAIAKIYVGTETVTGEATRIKKLNNAITIDGTVYLATEKDAVKMTTSEVEDNDFVTFNSTTVLDNEEVTLYLNVMGEYVAVSVAEDVSDYQFGIVTKVYGTTNIEEIDGDEYAQRSIKVLLENADEVRFTVQTNDDDKDTPDEKYLDGMFGTGKIEQGAFIVFVADADNTITLSEDKDEIMLVEDYVVAEDDYVLSEIKTTEAVTGKKFTTKDGVYSYTSDTVIFNNHMKLDTATDPDDEINQEVVTDWNSIINATSDKFEIVDTTKAYAVVKDGSTKALYIVLDSKYSASDYELAVVTRKLDEVKEGKYEIDFANQTDVEVDDNEKVIKNLTDVEDWVIEYTTKNGKVNAADILIDMLAIADADSDDVIKGIFLDGTELTIDENVFADNVNFAQLEVSEIYIDGDDYADITFSAGEDKVVVNEKYAFNKYKKDYYTDKDGTVSAKDETYSATATYYEKEYTKADVTAWAANTEYYELSGTTYTKVDQTTVTKPEDGKTYYTMAVVEVDLKDVDAKLGTIVLDAKELKVYDLRDGDVKETTLTTTENPGFSAVVYSEKNLTNNVIFIID